MHHNIKLTLKNLQNLIVHVFLAIDLLTLFHSNKLHIKNTAHFFLISHGVSFCLVLATFGVIINTNGFPF